MGTAAFQAVVVEHFPHFFGIFAEKAKELEMFIGYHAHGGDARVIDGTSIWERFFDATSKDVVMQMDLGNFIDGKGDPYKMLEKFKGRSLTVHLKESDQRDASKGNPIIGDGGVDWKRTFELCETIGNTEWYVVEDERGADSFDRIERSIAALRKMGK
jgi:sugar phosphate isomerase/epimerase